MTKAAEKYRAYDSSELVGWKSFPVRIQGPGSSACHDAPTLLVESMGGGFVTNNCGHCGKPSTLSRKDFNELDLPVNCPECRGPMQAHDSNRPQHVRLPTSNYAFRCDACRLFIELHWFLPKWSDLFTGGMTGAGFPQWSGGHAPAPVPTPTTTSDLIHCPHCDTLTDCVEVVEGELPNRPGNYVSTTSPDLHWLRRVRECQTCGNSFVTAELDEGHVGELARLQELETTLARHASSCAAKAREGAVSLEQMAGYLEQLLGPKDDAPEQGDELF